MTSLTQLVAFNMKTRRRRLGLSQARLAEMVNTAPTYIAMIELARKTPSFPMLERIAAALGMDAPELFSMDAYPRETLRRLHQEVLTEFDEVIARKLRELDAPALPTAPA